MPELQPESGRYFAFFRDARGTRSRQGRADERVDLAAEARRIERRGVFRACRRIPRGDGFELFDGGGQGFRRLLAEEQPGPSGEHGLERAALPMAQGEQLSLFT